MVNPDPTPNTTRAKKNADKPKVSVSDIKLGETVKYMKVKQALRQNINSESIKLSRANKIRRRLNMRTSGSGSETRKSGLVIRMPEHSRRKVD